ncbi:MAG TPA: hypothetical protein VM118_08675 [Acidobacteriota bacterium]|nr:hypothetical protein [Acidobacteriota bacterium]
MAARKPQRILICLLSALLLPLPAGAQNSGSGKAPDLPWQIAFVRSRNIWLMKADGSEQKRWKSLENIVGRPAWASDGKRVAFTRQGGFSYSLPDGGGGTHRLYDVFASHVDSTRDGFWWWITFNHGSRQPCWSSDGKYILYTRDMNANSIDAELPDYQIEYRTFDGSEVVTLTRPGAAPGECQGLEPTWSPDGKQIAFIYNRMNAPSSTGTAGTLQGVGLVVVPATGIVRSEDELERAAAQIPFVSGPSWSPDGQWIAYVDTRTDDGGIYLVTPDGATKKRILERTERIIPFQGPVSWSPDAKWITFASTAGYIFIMDSEGKSAPYRITSNGNDYFPSFAPK